MVPIVRWCDVGDGEADETARKGFATDTVFSRKQVASPKAVELQQCCAKAPVPITTSWARLPFTGLRWKPGLQGLEYPFQFRSVGTKS